MFPHGRHRRNRSGLDRQRPPVSIDLDAPPLAGQAQCSEPGCRRGLWFEGRRRPQKCWEHCSHSPKWSKTTELRPVPGDEPRGAATAKKKTADVERLLQHLQPVFVAALSRLLGDPKHAAEFVLGSADDQLAVARLVRAAEAEQMKAVREAHTAYHAQLAADALTLALLHAILLTPAVPAQSIAMHTKLIHQICQELGGSDAQFTEMAFELIVEAA